MKISLYIHLVIFPCFISKHQKKSHFVILVIILVKKPPFDRHTRSIRTTTRTNKMIAHVVWAARHPLTFFGCSSVFWAISAATDAEDVTIAATVSDLSAPSLRLACALSAPTESTVISVTLSTVAIPCPSSLKSVILIATLRNARLSRIVDMSRLYLFVVPRSIVCNILTSDIILLLCFTVLALLQPQSKTMHIRYAHI